VSRSFTESVLSRFKWNRRIRKSMGYDDDGGSAAAPLIDQVHRPMHLWKAGYLNRVDEYLDARGLRRNALFHQILQALMELASPPPPPPKSIHCLRASATTSQLTRLRQRNGSGSSCNQMKDGEVRSTGFRMIQSDSTCSPSTCQWLTRRLTLWGG